jgi:hypothetical protein
MKKKLLFAAGLVCMMLYFPSCELENCQICQQNSYDAATGALLVEGTESEYCGAALASILAKSDQITGGKRLSWECR